MKAEDNLPGGLGDEATTDQFDPKQVKMGIKVEMEHTDDPKVAEEIVPRWRWSSRERETAEAALQRWNRQRML